MSRATAFRIVSLLLITVLVGHTAPAQAGPSGLPPDTEAAVKAVSLDAAKAESLCKALEEMTAYTASDPKAMQAMMASMRKPLAERAAEMEKDPKAASILKAHGLGAMDYAAGVMALRAAAWKVGGAHGGLAEIATPGNVEVLRSNPAILEHFQKAESGRVR